MATYDGGNDNNGSDYDEHLPNPDHPKLQQTHEGEHHGDFGNDPVKITRSTYIYALCAAVNSCNLGYDIGVSTEASKLIQEDFDLTTAQREIFVGSINFWAMFGAFAAQYSTDTYGRRKTFIVAAVGFIIGVVVMTFSNSYPLLMLGRVFVGLGVGVGLAIDPLYIAEITPAKHRGELVTWSEIALNVGIVLGFSTGLIFKPIPDGREWRYMFIVGAILPVVMIVLVLTVMPESPRWLVQKNREEEAKEILQKIYPDGYNVDPVICDIKEALEREEAAELGVGWEIIMFPTPAFRRMLLVGVGTAVAQQVVGIDAIQYYLPDVLEDSGIESDKKQSLFLIVLGILKLIFIVVGGKLFDKKGRKPLLLVSLGGMACALLMLSLAFFIKSDLSSGFTVFGLALYLSFFSIGMGPGAWLIPSEVFATCIRAKAMSVATTLNRAAATLMSSTVVSISNALGWGGFFLMLCIVCLVVAGFLIIYLPETKGRSLEQMSIYFADITKDSSILDAEAKILKRRQNTDDNNSPNLQQTASLRGEIEML